MRGKRARWEKGCDACQRAKCRNKQGKKDAFDRIIEKWGDIVTMDTVDTNCRGVGGYVYGLCIADLYTDFSAFMPVAEKITAEIQEFPDSAPEFPRVPPLFSRAACRQTIGRA